MNRGNRSFEWQSGAIMSLTRDLTWDDGQRIHLAYCGVRTSGGKEGLER